MSVTARENKFTARDFNDLQYMQDLRCLKKAELKCKMDVLMTKLSYEQKTETDLEVARRRKEKPKITREAQRKRQKFYE